MDKPINTQKKVPAIRFQGFSGEWEEWELGSLGRVAMNKRIFKHQTSNKGDVPFFKIGTFGFKPDAFISRKLFDEYKEKYPFPEKGDLLISASGSIGRVVEYSGEDAYFQDSNIVWFKHDGKINNSFLKVFYSVVKWSGLEGSTIKRLYNKNILETVIPLPSAKEQTQIGDFFQALDDLIAKREQKHAKLRKIKQALLGKLFPQAGETVPQMRFIGFSGDWEERELKGICEETYGGGTPSTSQPEYWGGDIPWIQSSDIVESNIKSAKYKKSITKMGLKKSASKLVPENSLAIVTRVGVGKVSLLNMSYATSQDFLSLSRLNIDYLYSAYAVWRKMQSIKLVVQGTSIKGITKDELLDGVIEIPENPKEQTQIGNLFHKLDTLIKQYEQQITTLKNIKQGYLNKMFI